eukprot:TRINITY_DN13185_c0_g1_i1.p1 TRINITY_DN13185_c0_g1~~TRINITY_DN13185_c0_g1_i1.p1  ORF type:complete len:433 (+),score=104.11 TRINITY_DN13185_c0_g1_i1:80-1378(+)
MKSASFRFHYYYCSFTRGTSSLFPRLSPIHTSYFRYGPSLSLTQTQYQYYSTDKPASGASSKPPPPYKQNTYSKHNPKQKMKPRWSGPSDEVIKKAHKPHYQYRTKDKPVSPSTKPVENIKKTDKPKKRFFDSKKQSESKVSPQNSSVKTNKKDGSKSTQKTSDKTKKVGSKSVASTPAKLKTRRPSAVFRGLHKRDKKTNLESKPTKDAKKIVEDDEDEDAETEMSEKEKKKLAREEEKAKIEGLKLKYGEETTKKILAKEIQRLKFPGGWNPVKKVTRAQMNEIKELHRRAKDRFQKGIVDFGVVSPNFENDTGDGLTFESYFPLKETARRYAISTTALKRILRSNWQPEPEDLTIQEEKKMASRLARRKVIADVARKKHKEQAEMEKAKMREEGIVEPKRDIATEIMEEKLVQKKTKGKKIRDVEFWNT